MFAPARSGARLNSALMPVYSTDAIIVGAGAVGFACARALALRGHEVIVLEAADAIGQGVSSRNSEVLHAGIYYSTGH